MIERDAKLKVEHSVVIGLCRRELGLTDRAPTAKELSEWSHGAGASVGTWTVEQAQYMLDNPRQLFE